MTLSDRSVVFLVVAGLAAMTIASVGLAEKNNAFQDKVFELRVRELANTIDAMELYQEGEMTMNLPRNWTINFNDPASAPPEMEVNREGIDPVEVNLDTMPDTTTVQGEVICISKTPLSTSPPSPPQLTLDRGDC